MDILYTLRNLAIGCAIGVLLPFTVHYGVNAVIGSYPSRQDYGYTYDQTQKKFTFLSTDKEQSYEHVRKYHNTVHFYVNVIVALLALLFGVVTRVSFLGIGFIMAGVICLMTGYTSYWNYFNDLVRFVSLLLALVVLLAMSYRIAAIKK